MSLKKTITALMRERRPIHDPGKKYSALAIFVSMASFPIIAIANVPTIFPGDHKPLVGRLINISMMWIVFIPVFTALFNRRLRLTILLSGLLYTALFVYITALSVTTRAWTPENLYLLFGHCLLLCFLWVAIALVLHKTKSSQSPNSH